jgi:hypothetical protein
MNFGSPDLHQVARITGMSHCAWPCKVPFDYVTGLEMLGIVEASIDG